METQLDKRFGFLVADVDRLCGNRFDVLARSSLNLTRAQCRVLAYLSHYGEVMQSVPWAVALEQKLFQKNVSFMPIINFNACVKFV